MVKMVILYLSDYSVIILIIRYDSSDYCAYYHCVMCVMIQDIVLSYYCSHCSCLYNDNYY